MAETAVVHEEKTQEQLQDKIDLLLAVIDQIPGHVYWTDMRGIYIGANQEQQRMFALLADGAPMLGKTVYDFAFVPARHKKSVWARDQSVRLRGKAIVCEETAHIHGQPKAWYLSHKRPLRVRGKTVGLIGTSLDYTELKVKHIQYNQSQQQKLESYAIQTSVMYGVGHDLLTPCQGLTGLIEQMFLSIHSQDKEYFLEQLEMLQASTQSLVKYIKTALQETPLVSDNTQNKSINLADVIQSVESLLVPAINQKGLMWYLEYDQALPARIIGYEGILTKVLNNLITNAIKYTTKGSIKLIVSLGEVCQTKPKVLHKLLLIVRDTGMGIRKKDQGRIFEKFTQLNKKRSLHQSRDGDGVGLGLASLVSCLKLIGGSIDVTSKFGQGTAFTVMMPISLEDQCRAAHDNRVALEALDPEVKVTKVQRVLILEDDKVSAHVLKHHVACFCPDIDVVSSVEDGLRQCLARPYDIIFSDLNIVGGTAYDFVDLLQQARRQHKQDGSKHKLLVKENMLLVLLTSDISVETRQKSLNKGFHLVYHKPVYFKDIKKVMHDILL
jgi:two-component system, OmpR family, aerobic respiration control sensor histidine kinase ArcB